jgi:hypothetical protein
MFSLPYFLVVKEGGAVKELASDVSDKVAVHAGSGVVVLELEGEDKVEDGDKVLERDGLIGFFLDGEEVVEDFDDVSDSGSWVGFHVALSFEELWNWGVDRVHSIQVAFVGEEDVTVMIDLFQDFGYNGSDTEFGGIDAIGLLMGFVTKL